MDKSILGERITVQLCEKVLTTDEPSKKGASEATAGCRGNELPQEFMSRGVWVWDHVQREEP